VLRATGQQARHPLHDARVNDTAQLDSGSMWPASSAVLRIGPAEEQRITELVRCAVG